MWKRKIIKLSGCEILKELDKGYICYEPLIGSNFKVDAVLRLTGDDTQELLEYRYVLSDNSPRGYELKVFLHAQ